jgi:hypothetical protein
MDKLRGAKKTAFVAVAALAIVLAVSAPSQARGMGGHGSAGGHAGGAVGHGFEAHRGFEGHHDFDGRHFDRRHFDRGVRGGFVFVSPYPYYEYSPPAYTYDAPTYYWYCPSYGAYYPGVASCPDTWVPVPAS